MKLYDAAGRDAYLAGFHAAQALISERTGRSLKSHGGVNAEFHRLIRGDTRIDNELRAFLGFAYNLKAIADYETGPDSEISPERAAEAVIIARRFVTKVIELIGSASEDEQSSP
jgi:uncharacterized protein (UPF0332 family)